MAGERHLEEVLAAAGGAGVPGLLGLLLAMEAGVPVPIPSDLVMRCGRAGVGRRPAPCGSPSSPSSWSPWPAPPPCSWRPGDRAGPC